MSGLEDRLSLDISDALNAIDQLEARFVSAGSALQDALDRAVSQFEIPDTTVELTADVENVTPAIDDAIAAANTDLEVETDASAITTEIDDAIDAADKTVPVEADTSAAQAALDSLEAPEVDVSVDTTGIDEAADKLDSLGESGSKAGGGARDASEGFAAAGAGARLASGDLGQLEGLLGKIGPGAAGAVGGVTALAAATGVLFNAGLESISATQRFDQILGQFASTVNRVDVGGLNEDLKTLAIRLGDDDENLQNAAATMFNLGKNSGIAAPQVAQTTKEVIALAARAVALNPALGDVGNVAERLFTGLARGGRFAANFGLSLSTAEINARAFQNTGKTIASDLTLFEKSAAGAQLAVEKLGNGLSEDINAGADNVQFRLRALQGQFKESLDVLGEPLVEPIIEGLTDLEPVLESAAQAFGGVAGAVVPVVAALVDGLEPALAIVTPAAEAVADAGSTIGDVMDAIPGPVKAAAVSLGAFALALRTVNAATAAGATGRLASFITRFPALSSAVVPAGLALATVTATTELFNRRMAQGDEAVNEFISGIADTTNAATNIEELQSKIDAMRGSVNDLQDDAARAGGGPLGIFRQKGEVRDLQNGASALNDLANEAQTLNNKAAQLQRDLGISSERALELARGGDEAVEAFKRLSGGVDDTDASFSSYLVTLDRYLVAASQGKTTAEDLDAVMQLTGQSAEEVAAQFEAARQPVIDFANSIIESFPGAQEAIDKLSQDGTVSLQGFLDELTRQALVSAQFIGNIQTLIDRGATDLARNLSGLGAEAGGALAAEAASLTDEALAQAEANQDRVNEVNRNLATDTQNIANELNGGLEQAFNEAQAKIAARLEAMPGQLEVKSRQVGVSSANAIEQGLDEGFDAGTIEGAVISGLIGPIDDALNSVAFQQVGVEAAKKATANILGAFRAGFLISSPSKKMIEIGELVAEGFVLGLADIEGASEAIDPILDKMDEFKLSADDLARASGSSIDEIVASLDKLGQAQKEITPDELLKVGDAVKALGGSSGVKDLQEAISQKVSAAFGGIGGKEIEAIISKLNTSAALTKVTGIFGVTPRVPTPFETQVVKGADATALNSPNVELNVTVTPPPETTPEEQAFLVARAVGWSLQGVQ